MHAQCPRCRYVFEREPGYFLGAIVIGYVIAVCVVAAVAVLSRRLLPALSWESGAVLGFVAYLLLSPIVLRYARAIWMYLDYVLDPPHSR